jgi:hypothetical protein
VNKKESKDLSIGGRVWISLTGLGALGWIFLGDWRLFAAGLVLGIIVGVIVDKTTEEKK